MGRRHDSVLRGGSAIMRPICRLDP